MFVFSMVTGANYPPGLACARPRPKNLHTPANSQRVMHGACRTLVLGNQPQGGSQDIRRSVSTCGPVAVRALREAVAIILIWLDIRGGTPRAGGARPRQGGRLSQPSQTELRGIPRMLSSSSNAPVSDNSTTKHLRCGPLPNSIVAAARPFSRCARRFSGGRRPNVGIRSCRFAEQT